MKKTKISILSLSLILTLGVLNTSCSSDNDPIAQTETKSIAATNQDALTGMWKQEGATYDFYIQFNNGVFAGGPAVDNLPMVSKYHLEDGNIYVELETGQYNIIPYSFEDGNLIVIQSGIREVYSYYGEPVEVSNSFTDFTTLYASNWCLYSTNQPKEDLTIRFLEDGQFKYSFKAYHQYDYDFTYDKSGTYRIEKDQLYMNWNDGNPETVQTITIPAGTGFLFFSYPEESGKATIKFNPQF